MQASLQHLILPAALLLGCGGLAHAAGADSVANVVSSAVPAPVSSAVSSTLAPVAERTAAFIPGMQHHSCDFGNSDTLCTSKTVPLFARCLMHSGARAFMWTLHPSSYTDQKTCSLCSNDKERILSYACRSSWRQSVAWGSCARLSAHTLFRAWRQDIFPGCAPSSEGE